MVEKKINKGNTMTKKDFIKFALKVIKIKKAHPDSTVGKIYEEKTLEILKKEPTFSISKWKKFISRRLSEVNG